MTMSAGNAGSVVVIDPDQSSARTLQQMIEFLDTPSVVIADEDSWAAAVDDSVELIFLGRGLADVPAEAIESQLQRDRPSVAIVRIRDANGSVT
ncbi:MAG: hypothetical protein AAF265_03165 [Pseudomonadota bacterium]